MLSRFIAGMVTTVLIMLGVGVACGQDYPNKIIRMFAGPAGGGGDFTARLIAQGISGPLGQPVIVENRASGVVAAEAVSKASPDGYTMMFAGGSVWTFQLLQKAPYDVLRDFAPVSLLVREVFIVAVHPSIPAKSVQELIALAKARPGELNYSSVGVGGSAHLATELFKSMAGGINVLHVPYKGNAGAITALISGEVQMLITDGGLLGPHIKSGKIRALAVTSAEPSALAPGLPTASASGVPGYEAVSMTGVFVPANTPNAIINRLNQEFVRFLTRTDVKEQFLSRGAEVIASSPEQFGAAVKSDLARLTKVIKTAGIKNE